MTCLRADPPPHALAIAPVLALGTAVAALLIAFAHGYGYHRDELYFLAAGHHLAWSYPDQGPLTPLLAHLMSEISPTSLTVLRTPSALMTGGCVVVSGLIAREFGASGRAQLISAACIAAAPAVLSIGHLLSTSTYDLFAWSVVTWLIARAIRTQRAWCWLIGGLTAGTALLNKPLIAFLLASIAVGILVAGPRRTLGAGWVWAGAALAIGLWTPWLIWQGAHGWPQLHISSAIARGGSSTSQPRWALLPFQFLLAGPPLAPIWLVGLFALARRPRLRQFRCFAVSWVILVVLFEATGGKPYYLIGLLPVLFSAGALELDSWISSGTPQTTPGSCDRRTCRECGCICSDRASASSRNRRGPGRRHECRHRRDHWLARFHAGSRGCARSRAAARVDPDRELRGGRSHRSIRSGLRIAGRLQRPQWIWSMGTTARGSEIRHRRRYPQEAPSDVFHRLSASDTHNHLSRGRQRRKRQAGGGMPQAASAVVGRLASPEASKLNRPAPDGAEER